MVERAVIYHNPRCSKSRQTLQLLRDHGIEPTVVEYLLEPPAAATIETLIALLGIVPHALVRQKEVPYGAHGLTTQSSASEVAKAIAADPVLLERPVVVIGARAVIGRPPENVLELL